MLREGLLRTNLEYGICVTGHTERLREQKHLWKLEEFCFEDGMKLLPLFCHENAKSTGRPVKFAFEWDKPNGEPMQIHKVNFRTIEWNAKYDSLLKRILTDIPDIGGFIAFEILNDDECPVYDIGRIEYCRSYGIINTELYVNKKRMIDMIVVYYDTES